MIMYQLQILYSHRLDNWEVWKDTNSFDVRKICNGVGSNHEKFVCAGKPKLAAYRGIWEAAFLLAAGDVVKKATWCFRNFRLKHASIFSVQLMIISSLIFFFFCKFTEQVGKYFKLFMLIEVKYMKSLIYFLKHYKKQSS